MGDSLLSLEHMSSCYKKLLLNFSNLFQTEKNPPTLKNIHHADFPVQIEHFYGKNEIIFCFEYFRKYLKCHLRKSVGGV